MPRLSLSFLLARRRWLILAVAAALGLAMLAAGIGGGLDRALAGLRDGIRAHPASGEIHIVEIDAQSIAAINRWPWPRSIHAAAVDRLRRAGVRSIAFDVDFSNPSVPAEDEKFAAALVRAGGRVTLPTFRQSAGSGAGTVFLDSVPARPFADHAFLAAANVFPDPDGLLRRMPYGLETRDTPRPSIAAMVAESAGQIGRLYAIDFAIDPATIPRHSMVDLLGGRIAPSALAGKRILIGVTAVEEGDRYPAPRHGVLPGVVIQAMAAETLLAGPPLEPVSALWLLLLALASIFLALGGTAGPGRLAWLGVGGACALVLPFAFELLLGVSAPAAPALAALLAAALLAGAAQFASRYRDTARTDLVTGLPNLAALEAETLGRGSITMLVARIDGFAAIASALGPAGSADLVRGVAYSLAAATGAERIYRTDDSALAWIDAGGGAEAGIEAVAAAMRASLGDGGPVNVSLNFGIAAGDSSLAAQLVANAGLAALQASRRAETWLAFSPEHSEAAKRSLALLGELDGAIAAGRIWNAYQPKLDLRSGRIVGVEALVRWNHAELGPLAPDAFIPLLEEKGRAAGLTLHVLGGALADGARWREAGHDLHVAVNISATLLHDARFGEQLRDLLRTSDFPAELITVEVTESAAMARPEAAVAALEGWRALGLEISIDDYGTGQSSLSYLQRLPASELKIDRAFVASIETDRRNAIMVRSTIALAHELGLKVVAEGVEDESCLKALREMQCDVAQGFHIGRPMSAEAITALLAAPDGDVTNIRRAG